MSLRVRAFSHKTFRVYYMSTVTFNGIFGALKEGSLLIDILHQAIILAKGASSKMAPALCQKQMTPFRHKAEHFILFGLSDNDQILLTCGINTYYGITN